jgi:hypothetical protein
MSINYYRRQYLSQACCGMGGLALSSLLRQSAVADARPVQGPAQAVIFLFMAGGPSHIETFDPKPLLNRLHGQTRPAEFGEAKYQFVKPDAKLLGSHARFQQYGQSGIAVSHLFPQVANCVDDLAVVRSCYGDSVVHSAAQYELFSGRIVPGFPSMGAWVVYGLGSANQSLPSYVVLPDPDGALEAGQPMYMNGFLPAAHQPVMLLPGERPVLNLNLPSQASFDKRARTLELIRQLNSVAQIGTDHELEARIDSYELAFKMQTEAPEVFDLSGETQETLDLYGVGREPTHDYGRRCLLARRMVEKGVRFSVVVSGGGPGDKQWDAHKDIVENHERMAVQTDLPIAGLLTDLKRRGLLETTLVVWGGEFGRSPEAQSSKGRDHHNLGFTMWLAGGGIRGGQIVGATDEIGLRAIEQPYHFRDIHTTILHQLGFDQDELTYPHLGREERLTQIHGKLIQEII